VYRRFFEKREVGFSKTVLNIVNKEKDLLEIENAIKNVDLNKKI